MQFSKPQAWQVPFHPSATGFFQATQNLLLTSFPSSFKGLLSAQLSLASLTATTTPFPSFLACDPLKYKHLSQASDVLSVSLVRSQTPGDQKYLPILFSVVAQIPGECLGCRRCSRKICWIYDANTERSKKTMITSRKKDWVNLPSPK